MATAKQKALLEDIFAQANKLNAEHETYVAQFVTRANDELYKLLADMMQVCENIWDSNCEDYLHKCMRKELKEKWNIKTQKNTSTTALVVRYITRGNRQIVYNYAKVIDTAKAAGETSASLEQYIKNKGSIDAVRKKVVDVEHKKQIEEKAKAIEGRIIDFLRTKKNIGSIHLSNGEKSYGAGCCDVEFSLTLSMRADGEERAVATIYPSSTIMGLCYELYWNTCKAAALDDGSGKFYEACKKYDLNMDVVHRWMKDNGIDGPADALEMARSIYNEDYEYESPSSTIKLAA